MSRSRNRFFSSMSLLLLLGASMGVGATVPVSAATTCDDVGNVYSWNGIAQPWIVTHAHVYEHFTNGSGTYTKSVEMVGTITAGGSVNNDVSGGINLAIVHLGGKVGFTLAASGSTTTSSAISVKETMNQNGVYVFYDGHHRVSGNYTHTYCSQHTHLINATGSVHSYDAAREGALFCGVNPPPDTLAFVVKQKYCP